MLGRRPIKKGFLSLIEGWRSGEPLGSTGVWLLTRNGHLRMSDGNGLTKAISFICRYLCYKKASEQICVL
jgi:hypothetical protein